MSVPLPACASRCATGAVAGLTGLPTAGGRAAVRNAAARPHTALPARTTGGATRRPATAAAATAAATGQRESTEGNTGGPGGLCRLVHERQYRSVGPAA